MQLRVLREMFEAAQHDSSMLINGEHVVEAIASLDIEVLGLTYVYISDPTFFNRLYPPLSHEVYYRFLLHYFRRCILEAPDGEWADSRYTAAHAVQGWFKRIFIESSGNSPLLGAIKVWLQDLYLYGNTDVKRAVVDGVMEHLFENRKVMAFFRDWLDSDVFCKPYQEARLWVDNS